MTSISEVVVAARLTAADDVTVDLSIVALTVFVMSLRAADPAPASAPPLPCPPALPDYLGILFPPLSSPCLLFDRCCRVLSSTV